MGILPGAGTHAPQIQFISLEVPPQMKHSDWYQSFIAVCNKNFAHNLGTTGQTPFENVLRFNSVN